MIDKSIVHEDIAFSGEHRVVTPSWLPNLLLREVGEGPYPFSYFNLEVVVGDVSAVFEGFTDNHITPGQNLKALRGPLLREPVVHSVMGPAESPFLSIVGWRDVILFCPRKRSIEQIFSMDRAPDDDRGFRSLTLLGQTFGFILIYESGVVAFNHDGAIRWQHELTWNDVYIKSVEDRLYFSGEDKEGNLYDWAYMIDTGRVIDL